MASPIPLTPKPNRSLDERLDSLLSTPFGAGEAVEAAAEAEAEAPLDPVPADVPEEGVSDQAPPAGPPEEGTDIGSLRARDESDIRRMEDAARTGELQTNAEGREGWETPDTSVAAYTVIPRRGGVSMGQAVRTNMEQTGKMPDREQESNLKQFLAGKEGQAFQERLDIPAEEMPVMVNRDEKGRLALDTRPFEDRVMFSKRDQLAKEAGYTSWQDIPKEFARKAGVQDFSELSDEQQTLAKQEQEQLQNESARWARGEIVRASQAGRHLVFTDTDPDRTTEKIAELPPVVREVAATLAPRTAITRTPRSGDFQPERYGSVFWQVLNAAPSNMAAKYEAYAESDAPSRFADGDFVGWQREAAKAVWGLTEEQSVDLVRKIRENPMIAEYMSNEYGKLAYHVSTNAGASEEDAQKYVAWAKVSGGAFGFLTGDLVAPDPISMSLHGLGAAGKWYANPVRTFDRSATIIEDAAKATNLDYGSAIEAVRAQDPAAAAVLEMRVASDLHLPQAVRDSVRVAETKAKELADALEAKRAELGVEAGKEAENVELVELVEATKKAELSAAATRRASAEAALEEYRKGEGQLDQVGEKVWKDWKEAEVRAAAAKKALDDFTATHGADMDATRKLVEEGADIETEFQKVVAAEKEAREAKTRAIQTWTARRDEARKAFQEAKAEAPAPAVPAAETKVSPKDAGKAADEMRTALINKYGHQKNIPVAERQKWEELVALAKKAEAQSGGSINPLDNLLNEADAVPAAKAPATDARTARMKEALKAEAEANVKLKGLKEPTHAINTRMVRTRTTLAEAKAARQVRMDALRAAVTKHGPRIRDAEKLEIRADRAAQQVDSLRGSLAIMGVDVASGVHPAKQILESLEQAIVGGRLSEKAASQAVKDAAKIVAQAEALVDKAARSAKATERATGWRNIFTETGSQMRRGIRELERLPERGARFTDILTPATDGAVDTATGARRVDGARLYGTLERRYGVEAVDLASREAGPFGDLLRKLTARPGTVALSGTESTLLQDAPRFLEIAAKRAGPHAEDMQIAEAIENVRRLDPSIKPKNFVARMVHKARLYYDTALPSDVVRASAGAMSPEVQEVIKGAKNLSAQIDDEMITMVKRARAKNLDPDVLKNIVEKFGLDPSIVDTHERLLAQVGAIVQYIDTVKGIRYVGGHTLVNTISSETPWQIARRQMIFGDPRTREYVDALAAWRKQVAEIQTKYADDMATWESGVLPVNNPKPTPPKLPDAPGLPAPEGDMMPALRALTRSWLPSLEAVPLSVAHRLERDAIELLVENSEAGGTFVDFMAGMKKLTSRVPGVGMGHAESSLGRAFGFGGRATMHARVLASADDLLYRAIGGVLTKDQVLDMQRFVDNEWAKVGDFKAVLDGYNRMGMPVTVRTVRPARAAGSVGETTVRLVETGRGQTGESLFQTQVIAAEIERNMPQVTKELDARFARARTPEEVLGFQAQAAWVSAWKKSVITGLIVPNARYWLNNVAGDFSQMWFELGPDVAAKQTFQNLPVNIPVFGPWLQDFGSEMALKFHGKPVLGSVTNAMFNPWINRVWNGGDGLLRTKYGQTIPYQEARKWLVEDGILDTFIHEELPQAFSRVTPPWYTRGWDWWHDSITQFANFVQQRQRSGLYLELLSQGLTRDEAKRKTLGALYDWKHGVAEWEIRGWAKNIPFYRFWRLSMRQMMTAFTDPLLKPSMGGVGASLLGQSKLGRVRGQAALTDLTGSMSTWLDPELQAPYEDEQAQADAIARNVRPGWARDRGVMYTSGLKEEYIRALQESRGRVYTHTMTNLPPLTAIDTAGMSFSLLSSLAGGFMSSTGQSEHLAPDWSETFWEPAVSMFLPHVREPMEALLSATGADPMAIKKGSDMKVTPGEAAVIDMMAKSGMWGSTWKDEENGEPRAHTAQMLIFRNMPFVGTQLPKLMDSAYMDNPAVKTYFKRMEKAGQKRQEAAVATNPEQKSALLAEAERLSADAPNHVGAGLTWFMRRQLGIGPYAYSPEEEIKRRQMTVKSGTDLVGTGEAAPFSGYAPHADEGGE